MTNLNRPRMGRIRPTELRNRRRLLIPQTEENRSFRMGEEDPEAARARQDLHRFFEELLRKSEH